MQNELKGTLKSHLITIAYLGEFYVCIWILHAFIIGMLGRYMSNPGVYHWKAVNRVIGYLREQKISCLHIGDQTV